MKKIGKILHDRRVELNKTIEDVSIESKITTDKLNAIERGDLDYFSGDFSYLKFYIRFYCKYLGVDYEKYKDELFSEIDEFQNTEVMKKIELNQSINNSINENLKVKLKDQNHGAKHTRHVKVDYSLLTFIVVVIGVLFVMGLSLVKFFGTDRPDETIDMPPVTPIVTPTPEIVITPTPTPEIKEVELSVETVSFKEYYIKGFDVNQDVLIDINFNHDTWAGFKIDGVGTNNPASRIYNPGEKVQLIIKPKNELKVAIHLGYYKDNEIFINGKPFVLHDSVKDLTSGQEITLVFKGE